MLLALATLPVLAQTVPDLDPIEALDPSPSQLTLKLGGQADSAQGGKYQAKVIWNATPDLTLFLSGDRSNLESTSQAPSPSGTSTVTTTTGLGGAYLFGLFDLGLQYDHSDMSDLLTSQRYYLQPALDGGTWRFGLEFSTRKTVFDRLKFTGRTINTPSGPVTVSGYADLHLSDTGQGANFEFGGDVWRLFGSYTHYSYGAFEGTTDVTRIRDASGQVSSEIFKALYDRVVKRFEDLSASRLSGKAALLDSTATLGLEANLDRTRWILEVNQDVDHLSGEISNTCTGTAGWKATPTFTLELQLGATRSEAFGTDRFAGLALTFRTKPSF